MNIDEPMCFTYVFICLCLDLYFECLDLYFECLDLDRNGTRDQGPGTRAGTRDQGPGPGPGTRDQGRDPTMNHDPHTG